MNDRGKHNKKSIIIVSALLLWLVHHLFHPASHREDLKLKQKIQKKNMSSDQNYIATVVAAYWFVSISMVYLNKILMSNKSVSIEAPLFITWFQCVVTAAICWASGELAARFKKAEYEAVAKEEGDDEAAAAKPSFWSQFPKAEFKWNVAKRVFPLSLIFVGMITFNNLCLMWVEVSFYNVARSLTIVFNVIFSQYILGSYTSPKTMACLGIVMFGFFMGSKGEINFSLLGTVSGVLSSLFVSLNSILTKKVLPAVDNDHWKLTFYNNINACLLFLPMMVLFEWPAIVGAFGKQFMSSLFWSAMMVAGFFGFAIGTFLREPSIGYSDVVISHTALLTTNKQTNKQMIAGIVTVLQIKATSPLTHNISGTAKAAVQSMLAFYLWGNAATVLGVVSIFVVLGGSLLYTFVKMDENRKPVPQQPVKLQESADLELQKPLRS